jgi:hypothetical protein
MKKLIILLIIGILTTFCKNIGDGKPNNKAIDSVDISTFELPPHFKSVVINFIDSVHKTGSRDEVFNLTLRNYSQDTSVFWLTEEIAMNFLIEYPPLGYSKINNNYILYITPFERQVKSNFINSKLYYELNRILMSDAHIFDPRGIEIVVVRDSVIKVSSSCSGHVFKRRIHFLPPKRNLY